MTTPSETVLVTGAAGTVGHYVVALAEAAGYRVVANDLSPRGIQVPARGEVRAGDLRDPAVLDRVVEGVDHVVHTAAHLDVGAPEDALREVNVHVVERLFRRAREAGVRRFVQLSTALVYQSDSDDPLDEGAPVVPGGAVGRTKLAAEEILRGEGVSQLPWTILRAAPLYGRRGRHYAAALLAIGPSLRLLSPVLPRFTGGPRHNTVHAEDVARAALFVLPLEATHGQVLNVADEDALALGDRVTETLRAYGLPTVPAGQFPEPLLRQAGRLVASGGSVADGAASALWNLVVARHDLKPNLKVRLDQEALSLLHRPLVLDVHRLRDLGWLPRYPRFGEGWRQVLRWYQAEGWVPRYA